MSVGSLSTMYQVKETIKAEWTSMISTIRWETCGIQDENIGGGEMRTLVVVKYSSFELSVNFVFQALRPFYKKKRVYMEPEKEYMRYRENIKNLTYLSFLIVISVAITYIAHSLSAEKSIN